MARYVVYRVADGLVVNCISWNGDTNIWQPPAGQATLLTDLGQIGDTWDGAVFTTPTPPPYRYRAGTIYMGTALIDFVDGLPEAMVDIPGQDDLPGDVTPDYCYARA